eukprot:SAG22_NODE_11099_length_501_cov_1.077114_1_plen_49_part_00
MGQLNVLVCTCIGEEGLDVGEVDLVVQYDCISSALRTIQVGAQSHAAA